LVEARDLGSRAERRKSPNLSIDMISSQHSLAAFFAKILKNNLGNTRKKISLMQKFQHTKYRKNTKRSLK
jgi:hypothetical protein